MRHFINGLRVAARDCRGSTAVEFAVVLPVLALVTVGLIDIGLGVYTLHTIDHAAKQGARFAAIRGSQSTSPATQDQVVDEVESQATGVDLNHLTVNVIWPFGNTAGNPVQVDVSYSFEPMLAGFTGSSTYDIVSQSSYIILQ